MTISSASAKPKSSKETKKSSNGSQRTFSKTLSNLQPIESAPRFYGAPSATPYLISSPIISPHHSTPRLSPLHQAHLTQPTASNSSRPPFRTPLATCAQTLRTPITLTTHYTLTYHYTICTSLAPLLCTPSHSPLPPTSRPSAPSPIPSRLCKNRRY